MDRIIDYLEPNEFLEFFLEVFTEYFRCKTVVMIYLSFQKAFDKVPYFVITSEADN